MKFLIVLCLALAIASATEKPVFLKDLVIEESTEGRITNGIAAASGQFPYQVGLLLQRWDSIFWCGGSLIGTQYILTAAHCIDGVTRATVYLGSITRTIADKTVTVTSSAFIQHTGFNPRTLANDISLIRIPTVSLTSNINIIKLPKWNGPHSTYVGSTAIASGWGRTFDSSYLSNSLLYARLQVISNSLCAQTYGDIVINSGTICTSAFGGTSTCQGDSGGPLASNANNLIGVSSFVADTGCQSGSPAGFTRVTEFLDWIARESGIFY